MLFMRYRRKSVYDKFDNNQFQYNHEDDTVRYQGSPDGKIFCPPLLLTQAKRGVSQKTDLGRFENWYSLSVARQMEQGDWRGGWLRPALRTF